MARRNAMGVNGDNRNGTLSVRNVAYAAKARKTNSSGKPSGISDAGNACLASELSLLLSLLLILLLFSDATIIPSDESADNVVETTGFKRFIDATFFVVTNVSLSVPVVTIFFCFLLTSR